jgi:hypothetical protein
MNPLKRGLYFRLIGLSVLGTLILTAVSVFCLSYVSEHTSREHRNRFLLFLAESIENNTAGLSAEDLLKAEGQDKLKEILHRPPRPPRGEPHFLPPPPFPLSQLPPPPLPRPPRGGPPIQFWLFTELGELILAPEIEADLVSFENIKKPSGFHEMTAKEDFFRYSPGIYTIKIQRDPPLYLVARDDRRGFLGPLFITQAVLTLVSVLLSLGFSLSLVYFYMSKKSREASLVLRRLEQGDLKARFHIDRFDESSGLLLDFNRMADEIERLLTHVRDTEKSRTHLMQELGHDLKTPLTALKTSFETLKFHFSKMSEGDRTELLDMMGAEIEYFKELLETLMTMAQLDEPLYKELTETIDLSEIINQEIKSRQIQGNSPLVWKFVKTTPTPLVIKGDSHLILRLFKNALDNAARYARKEVHLIAHVQKDQIELSISDDGPGFDEASLQSFGTRSGKRKRREGQELHFSLGLGSFIMKTIAELHGGAIKVENVSLDGKVIGAKVSIVLPLSQNGNKF